MAILGEALHLHIGLLVSLPSDIQLLKLPDLHSVRGNGVPQRQWMEECYGPGDVEPQVAQCL